MFSVLSWLMRGYVAGVEKWRREHRMRRIESPMEGFRILNKNRVII